MADVKAAFEGGKIKLANLLIMAPESIKVTRNIEYGKGGGRPLLLDLYTPKKLPKPAPAILFIHGGAWKSGRKEVYHYYCVKFAERGYVTATVSYRLTGEAPFPAAVQDCKCAVRWMRANAKQNNVDPDRIAVAGGSAGGHLSLMIAYASDVPELEGKGGHAGVSSRVQAVVNLYGPTDLTTDFALKSGDLKAFLGGKSFADARKQYELASPITHLTEDDPPTLILHGTIDEIVPIKQADLLATKLKSVGVPHVYDRLKGWPHTMDLSADVNERCQWFMAEFFAKHLAGKAKTRLKSAPRAARKTRRE